MYGCLWMLHVLRTQIFFHRCFGPANCVNGAIKILRPSREIYFRHRSISTCSNVHLCVLNHQMRCAKCIIWGPRAQSAQSKVSTIFAHRGIYWRQQCVWCKLAYMLPWQQNVFCLFLEKRVIFLVSDKNMDYKNFRLYILVSKSFFFFNGNIVLK